jgi:hypothetical protein
MTTPTTNRRQSARLECVVATLILVTASASAGEWRRFRGGDGSGVSNAEGLPTEWSEEKGVA